MLEAEYAAKSYLKKNISFATYQHLGLGMPSTRARASQKFLKKSIAKGLKVLHQLVLPCQELKLKTESKGILLSLSSVQSRVLLRNEAYSGTLRAACFKPHV